MTRSKKLTLIQHIAQAESVAAQHSGVLPSQGWLATNGYSGLAKRIGQHRESFAHIPQDSLKYMLESLPSRECLYCKTILTFRKGKERPNTFVKRKFCDQSCSSNWVFANIRHSSEFEVKRLVALQESKTHKAASKVALANSRINGTLAAGRLIHRKRTDPNAFELSDDEIRMVIADPRPYSEITKDYKIAAATISQYKSGKLRPNLEDRPVAPSIDFGSRIATTKQTQAEAERQIKYAILPAEEAERLERQRLHGVDARRRKKLGLPAPPRAPFSEDTRAKIRASKIGKKRSSETIERMRIAASIPIISSDGTTFESTKAACEHYDVHQNTIRRWIKKGRLRYVKNNHK